jgi:hypothetical protein
MLAKAQNAPAKPPPTGILAVNLRILDVFHATTAGPNLSQPAAGRTGRPSALATHPLFLPFVGN